MDDIVIKNGCLVLPEKVLPGGVMRINDGLITSIDCTENSYDDKSAYTLVAGGRLASHDDDCPAQVERLAKMGVTISDFPVSLRAARSATLLGYYVCVGAPNVVRGRSVSGNLSALEAVKDGAAQVLCSDYYPASILHAVFRLVQEGFSLPWAVNLAA